LTQTLQGRIQTFRISTKKHSQNSKHSNLLFLAYFCSLMQFELTEEHLAVQQAARDFAQTELLPGVIERDEHQKFPAEQVKKLGELGFMGMMVDPKYGGSGMDTISYVLAMEEISKVDASCSVVMSVNNSLVCWGLETFGTEEQKQKYLVPLAKGEIIGAFLLSEPEAGSDATSQRTIAEDKGDHYLLNGTKNCLFGNGSDRCCKRT
jgi:alkylation response protein AidB-like acyl-CoA dehydrogenase